MTMPNDIREAFETACDRLTLSAEAAGHAIDIERYLALRQCGPIPRPMQRAALAAVDAFAAHMTPVSRAIEISREC